MNPTIKISNLTKYLLGESMRNIIPLVLWLLIIPLRLLKINSLVAYLRKKRVTFYLQGREIQGRVAHVGTIKEVIVEKDYEINQKKIKGDIIDAGANIGIAQLVLRKLIQKKARMICVEPDPYNVALLIENTQNCEIVVSALSNDVGHDFFNFSSTGITGHLENIGENKSESVVKVTTIDQLTKNNKLSPGLIKIDVEGADLKVIEGAKETLKKFHPIIIIEIHSIGLVRSIRELLSKAGYNYHEERENNIWMFRRLK